MSFRAALGYRMAMKSTAENICATLDAHKIPSRVVVCDDNKASHALIEAALRGTGKNIKSCFDIKDAYSEFLSNNIILYAINYKFAHGLQHYLPKCTFPIIFFSDDISNKEEIEKLGFKFVQQSELFKLRELVK